MLTLQTMQLEEIEVLSRDKVGGLESCCFMRMGEGREDAVMAVGS